MSPFLILAMALGGLGLFLCGFAIGSRYGHLKGRNLGLFDGETAALRRATERLAAVRAEHNSHLKVVR